VIRHSLSISMLAAYYLVHLQGLVISHLHGILPSPRLFLRLGFVTLQRRIVVLREGRHICSI
jgi:hypothetical protein